MKFTGIGFAVSTFRRVILLTELHGDKIGPAVAFTQISHLSAPDGRLQNGTNPPTKHKSRRPERPALFAAPGLQNRKTAAKGGTLPQATLHPTTSPKLNTPASLLASLTTSASSLRLINFLTARSVFAASPLRLRTSVAWLQSGGKAREVVSIWGWVSFGLVGGLM